MRPRLPILLGIHVKITCLQGFYKFQLFLKRKHFADMLHTLRQHRAPVLLKLIKYGKMPTIVVPIGVMQTHVGYSSLHCILTIPPPSGLIVGLYRGTKCRVKLVMAYLISIVA